MTNDAQPGPNAGGDPKNYEGERTCFVIGPVGGERTPIREHSDRLFRHVIEPAATDVGLGNVVRSDHISGSGVITNEILNLLVDADAVVADLSFHNANAFYELAYRHIARKPFAHLIRVGEPLPFDVGTSRAITFEPENWDSALQTRDRLAATLRAELAKSEAEIETPFSVALDLRSSAQQPDDEPYSRIERLIHRMDRRLNRIELASAQVAAPESDPVASRGEAGYQSGDRVLSPTFGPGVVVSAEPLPGGERKLTVAFEGKGVTQLVESYAHLERVP